MGFIVRFMQYDRHDTPLYRLLLSARSRKYPKGQLISAFGDDSIHLIKAGYIQRYLITKEGSKGIQVIYGPSDIFPLTPVYKSSFNMDVYSGPEDYYYESITEAQVFSMSQEQLAEALRDDPSIYKDLFFAAGLRLNSYIHRLESMSTGSARRKIVHQLAYLAGTFGKQTPEGTVIELPLTHQRLAEILNLARETVTNELAVLTKKELIQGSKTILVPDIQKLLGEL